MKLYQRLSEGALQFTKIPKAAFITASRRDPPSVLSLLSLLLRLLVALQEGRHEALLVSRALRRGIAELVQLLAQAKGLRQAHRRNAQGEGDLRVRDAGLHGDRHVPEVRVRRAPDQRRGRLRCGEGPH